MKFIGISDMEVCADFMSILGLENFLRQLRTKNHSIRNFEVIAVAKE